MEPVAQGEAVPAVLIDPGSNSSALREEFVAVMEYREYVLIRILLEGYLLMVLLA